MWIVPVFRCEGECEARRHERGRHVTDNGQHDIARRRRGQGHLEHIRRSVLGDGHRAELVHEQCSQIVVGVGHLDGLVDHADEQGVRGALVDGYDDVEGLRAIDLGVVDPLDRDALLDIPRTGLEGHDVGRCRRLPLVLAGDVEADGTLRLSIEHEAEGLGLSARLVDGLGSSVNDREASHLIVHVRHCDDLVRDQAEGRVRVRIVDREHDIRRLVAVDERVVLPGHGNGPDVRPVARDEGQ